MADGRTIRIIGGGLAGLTLGIALRQQAVPVIVAEAGRYPRHRVCGEFINGRGRETLARLGLEKKLFESGARSAVTAAFYADGKPPIFLRLPAPALCISRYILDDMLAHEFTRIGGALHLNERSSLSALGEGVVRATGRQVRSAAQSWRWFGLKAHAREVTLQADLELHFFRDHYVGLCQLQDEVNVCGLFRSRSALPDLGHTWPEVLRGTPGTELFGRLGHACFNEQSFCAVAGLDPLPHLVRVSQEFLLGDALTMIPPMTGNGMSLALESAELAVEPLVRYCQGEVEWEGARQQFSGNCHRRFRSRLQVAALLHRMIFHPSASKVAFSLLRWFPDILESLIRRTR